MKRGKPIARFVAIVALVGAGSAPAWGQRVRPTAAAAVAGRDHFLRGVQLVDDGDFHGALAEFVASYEASGNPLVLINVAIVREQLNEYSEAMDAIERAEREAPPAALAARRADIDAALLRLRERVGFVIVGADAPGLTVTVDGVEQPRARVREGIRVSVGQHRVALRAPGYVSRESQVNVPARARVEMNELLERVRSTIAVRSNVAAARVLIDGHAAGTTPVASPIAVEEGRHEVRVERDGYTSFATVVDAVGRGADVNAQLTWLDPIPETVAGHLVIRATEPGALVRLDGRRIEANGSEMLPSGPHLLRIERANYVPVERSVTVRAAATRTIDIPLQPTPAYRNDYMASATAARTRWLAVAGVSATVTTAGGVWFAVGLANYVRLHTAYWDLDQLITTCRMSTIDPRCARSGELVAMMDSAAADLPYAGAWLAVGGTVMAAGIGGLIASIVMAGQAPALDRFERRPVWHIGFGPLAGTMAVVF